MRTTVTIIYLLLIFIAAPVWGTQYYVSPTGDDSNDGLDSTTAWLSIDNGEQKEIIVPGDTVNIMPGVYTPPSSIQLKTDGLDSTPIVYRKFGKAKAIIDADGHSNIIFVIEGNYVEVHNLELTNSSNDGINTKSSHVLISGCSIHTVNKRGIRIEGPYNLIRHNVIYNTGEEGIKNEGPGNNGIIHNNTIYSCGLEGIELKAGNSRVFNNIVVQNEIGIKGSASDVCGFNNVWGNSSGNYDGASDSAGGISRLAKFVDPDSGRFDLKAIAFEINAGLDLGYAFNGTAPEIGAFEKYNVYYVSPTGTDSNNGLTIDSAWASIDNGDSLLFPGDTVYVLPGVYVDSVVITDNGLLDDMIVYQGIRDSCMIDGTGIDAAVAIAADYVNWSGLSVANAQKANIIIAGGNNLVQESVISRAEEHGIYIASGVQNRFERNVLSLNNSNGMYVLGDGAIIYNCSFYDSASVGINAASSDLHSITNCIFLGKEKINTAIKATATTQVTYCIFYNTYYMYEGPSSLGTGCFAADPLFINPDGGNLRLQSYSPAIDAGVFVGLPFEGAAPDRGAYETGILASLTVIANYDSLIADSSYQFEVLAYDSVGFPAGPGKISWSHTFATGSIDTMGNFQPQLIGSGEIEAQSSINEISGVSPTMTVVPGSLNKLFITPNKDTISTDETRQFSASGRDRWGNEVGALGVLSWQVHNNIGTIDADGLFDARRVGNGFIRVLSDLGPSQLSDTITVIPGSITYIDVIPITNIIVEDSSHQYSALGMDADSNVVKDLTDSVSWTTTDPSGSITPGGLYTAGNNPSPPIYYNIATYQGVLSDFGEVSVISNGQLSYIQIEWQDGTPFGDTTFTTDDDTVRLFCRGYTSGDVVLGDISVDWALIGNDSIGSAFPLSAISTTLELYNIGIGQVVATYSSSLADTTGTINCLVGQTDHAIILPDSATISADSSLLFTMSSFDADGNPTVLVPAPTWNIIGDIGDIDITGEFNPGTAGIGFIVGSSGGIADTTGQITVVPGELNYIAVVPDSALVSADSTLQYTAQGYDSDDNLRDPGVISWAITSALGTIDMTGLFDPVATGQALIIATSDIGPVDTSAYLEVIPGQLVALTVSPDSVDVNTDNSVIFSTAGVDSDGNAASIGTINWTVIGDIGDINSSGLFTPLTTGAGKVAASSSVNGISDTNQIVTVYPGKLDLLVISPNSATLQIGDSVVFSATGYDARYNLTDTGPLTWSVIGSMGIIDSTGVFVATTSGVGYVHTINDMEGVDASTGTILVEAFNISSIPLGNQSVRPHQSLVPLLTFHLDNSYSTDKQFEALTIRDGSHGPGDGSELLTNVDSIALYFDLDDDSILSPADSLMAVGEYSSGLIDLTFSPVNIPSGYGRSFIVAADISLYPHDSDSIDIFLQSASDVQISDATPLLGPATINSLGYAIVDGLVKEQLIQVASGTATINPGDTLYNCLIIDIPRNGYLADNLEIIDIANSGTADIYDIDSMTLYQDDGNGIWGGPGEEIRMGILNFTGSRWTLSGLAASLTDPLTRFHVGVALTDYPESGATISLYIPANGLDMSSGNDGPTDGPTLPLDIIVIETNEEVQVTAVPIPARELIPGQPTGPLAGFEFINGYGNDLILDSMYCSMVAYDPDGATQDQLDSQIDNIFLYMNRDGDYSELGVADTLIASAVLNSGTAALVTDGIVLPQDGGIIGLSVSASLNLNNSKDGNSLNFAISNISDMYFSQPIALSGDFPLSNDADFYIDAFPYDRTATNPVEAGTFFGGQSDQLVMDFVLPANGYSPDTLELIRIINRGTLDEYNALLAVKLWVDNTGDGYSPDDLMLGRFVPDGQEWEANDLGYPIEVAGARFFITIDVASDQTEAGTLQFEIPVEGVTYRSGMIGPDDMPINNPDAHLVFPSNRIFAISKPTANSLPIMPFSSKNIILSFALYNGYVGEDHTLEAVKLSNVSHSASDMAYADYEVGQISLYVDSDGSRTFNDDSLIATGIPVNGYLQLSGLNINLAAESLLDFFVLIDVPGALIDSDSLALEVSALSDFVFADQVIIGGDMPLSNGEYLIVDGSVRDQFGVIDLPPRSVSPGDTSLLLFAFEPAFNGDQPDLLHSITLENLGSADSSDIPEMELWLDTNNDSLWQDGDTFLGFFNYVIDSWQINALGLAIGTVPQTLLMLGDIADSTRLNATFRGRIPINGCQYGSGNDGPIDSAIVSENTTTVSSSGLAISISPGVSAYSVGQTYLLQATVTNLYDFIIDDVTCELISGYDPMLVILDSSFAGPDQLAPRESRNFRFYFTTINSGILEIQLHTVAPYVPDTSAQVSTGPIIIQEAPVNVYVQLINSMPTSVIKGQSNVFPLSLTYEHPDSLPTIASLQLDSLLLSVEDGSGQSQLASSVFSRMSLAAGYSTVAVLGIIPSSSSVWLRFSESVIVHPGENVLFSLLVDIDSAAAASDFVLKISDAASLPVVDRITQQPVPFDALVAFPLKTASCRVDNPSNHMFVSSESVAGGTANYGQDNVATLRVDARHPGSAGNSQIQMTSLSIQCLDNNDSLISFYDLFNVVAIQKGNLIIGANTDFGPGSKDIIIDLNSPITLNPGESEAVTILVEIKQNTVRPGFRISIPDSNAFVVRDLSSGSLLPTTTDTLILATGLSAFPMTSDWITLKQQSVAPEICITSTLPESIIGGVDSLELVRMTFDYSVSSNFSSVKIYNAHLSVLDSTGGPLDPALLFDRIGYSISGGSIEYLPFVYLENGQALFLFGADGILLGSGDYVEIALVADIKPDAPFDNFEILIYNTDAISVIDVSDTTYSPGLVAGTGCNIDFPFTTGVTEILLPAGRPLISTCPHSVRTAYPGQEQVPVFNCGISYQTPVLKGDLILHSLRGKTYRRTADGLFPIEVGELAGSVQMTVNGGYQPGTQLLDGDSVLIILDQGLVISRNDQLDLDITCNISGTAAPGNYVIEFVDSTFIDISDRDLGATIYPVLQSGIYPLYSTEISLVPADLQRSFRNYPNPFNPTRNELTTIAYVLSADAQVDIEIFTITGKAVKVIANNEFRSSGSHQTDAWSGINDIGLAVVPGTYFCRIIARYITGEVEELKRKIAVVR